MNEKIKESNSIYDLLLRLGQIKKEERIVIKAIDLELKNPQNAELCRNLDEYRKTNPNASGSLDDIVHVIEQMHERKKTR